MPKFNVNLVWTMTGNVIVEADSKEQARIVALGPDVPLPTDGFYLDGSFEVYDVEEDIDLVKEAD